MAYRKDQSTEVAPQMRVDLDVYKIALYLSRKNRTSIQHEMSKAARQTFSRRGIKPEIAS